MTITTDNLHLHTGEQVYNHIRDHLLSMSHRSMRYDGETCAYRGANGAKCAAGILIADNQYISKMEGHTWESLIHADVFGIPKCHVDLIADLQCVHDSRLSWNEGGTGLSARGIARLADVARKHKLLPSWNNLPA